MHDTHPPDTGPAVRVEGLSKSFVLHTQAGTVIPVFDGLSLDVHSGECLALVGPSGSGKSTLMRSVYGNYKPSGGRILVRHAREGQTRMVDMACAGAREILRVRRTTIGYVSQFLRVIPRVPARDVVAEPLAAFGIDSRQALERAEVMLERLNIPKRLRSLPPATFSGGEQQRVNIARGFIADFPVLLLDEPTASLDPANQRTVLELIAEAKSRGTAMIGIFHDPEICAAVAERTFELMPPRAA